MYIGCFYVVAEPALLVCGIAISSTKIALAIFFAWPIICSCPNLPGSITPNTHYHIWQKFLVISSCSMSLKMQRKAPQEAQMSR